MSTGTKCKFPRFKMLSFAFPIVVVLTSLLILPPLWGGSTGVPEAYYQFIMDHAPYVYVTPGVGTDSCWGRTAFAAAFAIDFLHRAYSHTQFVTRRFAIHNMIVTLADFILSQQFVLDTTKTQYGGFRSSETSQYFYSVDAARIIPALIRAYDLTGRSSYLNAARLAGSRFLYAMQNPPVPSIVDKYHGGFVRGVNIAEGSSGSVELWLTQMDIENLYALIGLKMLIDYDPANQIKYEKMMLDAIGFLRSGFEKLYLYYDPSPTGKGKWRRVGLGENEIYDDSLAYALLGVYEFEGWSTTVQRVYNSINTIGPSPDHPSYNPSICWAGYIDVISRLPACDYYDAVTAGILWKIRKNHDKANLDLSIRIVREHVERFMFWGVRFSDFSYVDTKQSMASICWLSLLFLEYQNPIAWFT